MTDQPLANKDKVRAEIEKDPGKTSRAIAKLLGMDDSTVRKKIHELEGLDEPADKKLMAKREVCLNGGAQVVKTIKEQPGASYRKITSDLGCNKKTLAVRIDDPDIIFKRLVKYCKNYKDKELRQILKTHIENWGYWPNRLEKPK